MKAELVESMSGEKRVLLTSESAEERALIQSIGNAGTAIVVITGSEKEPGKPTEHYLSLVAGERNVNDEDERAHFHDLDDDEDDDFDHDFDHEESAA